MLAEWFLFLGKSLVVFLFIAGIIVVIGIVVSRAKQLHGLEVEPLADRWEDYGFLLGQFRWSKKELKAEQKKRKDELKKREKDGEPSPQLFVLRFDGDIHAQQVENLREEITAILQVAKPQDEVVCLLDSPGGAVTGYGLAAAQLLRIRNQGIPLTVAVDEVAASGGYMMACVANKIIAAPFALFGSIGVVAQFPNFYRFFKRFDIDYKQYTAGEFKRTVSPLAEITEKGEQKFIEQLDEIHSQFKIFVGAYRPQLDLAKVATGEAWFGERALALGLVDEITVSDDFLLGKRKQGFDVLKVKFEKPKKWQDKISDLVAMTLTASLNRVLHRWGRNPW